MAVDRYQRKLDNRIDRLRHAIELEILSRHAAGSLFDCTIGVGRFIGQLPKVSEYTGMDLSPEFVAHVNASFPSVNATVGDLTLGIDKHSNSYDTVLCLRSLSAIGHVAELLAEMTRIARPGGCIVVDYGRAPVQAIVGGQTVLLDDAPIDKILLSLPLRIIDRVRLDALLTRIKRRARVFRALHRPAGRLVPDRMIMTLERALLPLAWERQIIVARKQGD